MNSCSNYLLPIFFTALLQLFPTYGNATDAMTTKTMTQAEDLKKHLYRLALEANVSLHDPVDFEETPGKGVYAAVDGAAVIVGRDTFLQENNIDISNVRDPLLHEEQGFSTLYIACDNECIGWVGMQDKTRPEAKKAVVELTDAGVKRITMLTGDRAEVANRFEPNTSLRARLAFS